MSNHMSGDLIAKFAAIYSANRDSLETPLGILDRAVAKAKSVSGFTPDAEFESSHPIKPGLVHLHVNNWTDLHPEAPLGMLMVEVFAPNGLRDLPKYWPMARGAEVGNASEVAEEEKACDLWYAEIGDPFRKRYGLC